jgi:hypothetical protein
MAKSAHADDTGIGDLVKNAIDDVQELVKIEIALAKQEIKHDTTRLKSAAIAFGVAAAGGILALSMLLVALLIAIGGGAAAAIAIAAILLGSSVIAGAVGYRLIPRDPGPEKTVENVKKQTRLLTERVA